MMLVVPMLAKPIRPNESLATGTREYLYEEKFDGLRAQICIDHENKLTMYSRNKFQRLEYRLPEPPIKYACQTIQLDGELVFIDPRTNEIKSICGSGTRSQLIPKLFVFDVLYINGKSVMNLPLARRKELLAKHINVECQVPWKIFNSWSSTLEDYRRIVEKPHGEGLILKNTAQPYMPGRREWLKLKRGLSLDAIELDLYCNAMCRGRNGTYTILDCGYFASNDRKDYVSVCKVSNLTTAVRGTIQLMMGSTSTGLLRMPIVVELRAQSITPAGSLRHPTFSKMKPDPVTDLSIYPFDASMYPQLLSLKSSEK